MNESKKLYSQKSIGLASYIGGPLAASYLIRQNSLALGKEKEGRNALILGVVSTFLLFAGILSVPEAIMDKVPNFAIPAIYTALIYLIVEKIHGKALFTHTENKGEFESRWKAAGIGSIGLLILAGFILSYASMLPDELNFDTVAYDNGINKFVENEEKALKVYGLFETEQVTTIQKELAKGLVIWEENRQIMNELIEIENLPSEIVEHCQKMGKYCDLRIEHYQLLAKTVSEDTNKYQKELEIIVDKINQIIDALS